MAYLLVRTRTMRPDIYSRAVEELTDARTLFERFHDFAPPTILRRRCPPMPPVLVKLGRLRGVIYSSDKWQSGKPRTYIHFMDRPPLLACDPTGTQLHIVGGCYRVTARGIEG